MKAKRQSGLVNSRALKTKSLKTSSKTTKLTRSRPRDVQARPSFIKGAGMGLFAQVDMAKGTLLPAPYQGRPLTWEEFLRTKDQRYCYTVNNDGIWAVDALKLVKGNPCRFVNGAMTAAQRSKVNVCGIFMEDKQVWFVTSRAVSKGEEFLIDYGPGYWKEWKRLYERPKRIRAEIRELLLKMRRARPQERSQLDDRLEDLREELEDTTLGCRK